MKGNIFLHWSIQVTFELDINYRENELKTDFFTFFFSLIIGSTFSQFCMHIHNIHLQGTVFQIIDIGLSFILMQKSGKIFIIFSSLFFYIS